MLARSRGQPAHNRPLSVASESSCHERGLAIVEGIVTLGIVASLSAGLALFIGRTTKALYRAKRETHTSCADPSCSQAGETLRCVCRSEEHTSELQSH